MPSIEKVKRWYAQSFEVSCGLSCAQSIARRRRQRGIRDGIRNALTFLRRAKEGVLEILGKLWSREIDETAGPA
jgi:hypothetical protein